MEDVIVQQQTDLPTNGHCINEKISSIMTESDLKEPPTTLSSLIATAAKITLLFFWYLLTSFTGIFHKKKKSIRNDTVLVTGSGGYLGKA